MHHLVKKSSMAVVDGADQAITDGIAELPIGLLMLDKSDCVFYWNSVFLDMFPSLSAEESVLGNSCDILLTKIIAGGNIAGSLAATKPSQWIEQKLEFFQQQESHSIERLADGRWIEITHATLSNGNKSIYFKNATDNIKSQMLLAEVMAGASDGIAIWDQRSCLTVCDDRFGEIFASQNGAPSKGQSFEEVLSAAIAGGRVVLSSDPRHWIGEMLANRREIESQTEITFADGETYVLTERRNSEGGLVSTITAVTELKLKEREVARRAEELERANSDMELHQDALEKQAEQLAALAEDIEIARDQAEKERARAEESERLVRLSHDELELRVAERTKDLRAEIQERVRAEKELIESKVAAEQANISKSEFLANMSHEFRTPLNAVIGFSDTIIQEIFGPIGNERYSGYLNDIQSSAQHLLELINDILDISAIDVGKIELNETEVDTVEVLSSCIGYVTIMAQDQAVELTTSISEKLPVISVDERRLKQIIINLLSIAVKFTPEGGRVTLFSEIDENGDLIVQVIDTGIGIATENIAKALSPFDQIDRGETNIHEGTGLGLPLSKNLAELMGGHFEIESKVGKGTTVTLILPVSTDSQPSYQI